MPSAAGAGANTACWLAVAGCGAAVAGRIGCDPFGAWLADDLARHGVVDALVRDDDRPTGTCIVLVSPDGERTMVPDAGANAALHPYDLPAKLFGPERHLHLSGYTLFGPGRAAGIQALARARAQAMTVSVDAASAAPLRTVGPEEFLAWLGRDLLLFANLDEATLLAGQPGTADPGGAARRLGRQLGVAVVKLGPDGAIWSDGTDLVHQPADLGGTIVDTTGAGDAFAAGMLAATRSGATPADALRAGHVLAAQACAVVGGRPPG